MKQIKHRTIGHDKYFLSKTVTRQWNQHATKQARATEHDITIHSQPQKMGSGVREKQTSVYLSKCIFWNVPGIRMRFSNCSGNRFLNSSATWKESKNKLSPPSTSGSNLQTKNNDINSDKMILLFSFRLSFHNCLSCLETAMINQVNIFLWSERYSLALSCVCQEF